MEPEDELLTNLNAGVPSHRRDPQKERLFEALDFVRDFVTNSEEAVNAEAKQAIDSVLEDHHTRLKLFLVAISKLRVSNIASLVRDIEELETHMVSQDYHDMTPKQLVDLYKVLTERQKTMVEYLVFLSGAGFPTEYDVPEYMANMEGKLKDHGVDAPGVQSRRNVTALIEKVAGILGEEDG